MKYKRVLLKLSGEALAGDSKFGIDSNKVDRVCNSIKQIIDQNVELSILFGCLNFLRGINSLDM